MHSLEGGCCCGAVRYRVGAEPVVQLLCYCKDCLAITGSDGCACYIVKDTDFEITSGQPNRFDTQSKADRVLNRYFCGECGTNVYGQTELGLVSVAAGTLDDASVFEPTRTVHAQDAPHWARIPEHLKPM